MKRTVLILGVLGFFGTSASAHPMGFKVYVYSNPGFSAINSEKDSLLFYESGIDMMYDWNSSFQNWCDRNNDTIQRPDNRKIYYLIDCPGQGGWRFYTTGYGMVGRYVDWRLCGDSMALWNTLADMCIDTFLVHHGDTAKGFGAYRLMDGDSGYVWGTSLQYAFEGLQKLYDRLQVDEAYSGTPKTHYTYLWGSYDYPKSIDYYLDIAPGLDVFGPGAYIFQAPITEESVQNGLTAIIKGCRTYVPVANARGKVYMPLVQCSGTEDNRPTREELRATSWVPLAYGSAWLGYYYYKGWPSYGVVGETNKPYVLHEDTLNNHEVFGTLEWNSADIDNSLDDGWINLYRVIQEIEQIGPTLGNLRWVDGFSKTECPRGWDANASVVSAAGADSIDLGLFTHDKYQLDAGKYLMVVNRNTRSDNYATITVRLDFPEKPLLAVKKIGVSGGHEYLEKEGDGYFHLTDDYIPGAGKLFRLLPEKYKLRITMGKCMSGAAAYGYMGQLSFPGSGCTALLKWRWQNKKPQDLDSIEVWRRVLPSTSWSWRQDADKDASAGTLIDPMPSCTCSVHFLLVGYHADGDTIVWPPELAGQVGTISNVSIVCCGSKQGCPDLYTFFDYDSTANPGYSFIENNTILPHSEHYQSVDEDLLKLDVLNTDPDYYYMNILENDDETSYLDQVRLWVVDHPEGTEVASSADGNVYVYSESVAPASCTDEQDTSRLDEVLWEDSLSYGGASGSYLTVRFEDPGWLQTGLLMSLGRHKAEGPPTPKTYSAKPCKPGEGGGWDSLGVGFGRLNCSQWLVDVSEVDSFTFRVMCGGSDSTWIDRLALVKLEDDWNQTEALLDSAVHYDEYGDGIANGYRLFYQDTLADTLREGHQISLRFDKVDTSTTYPVRNFVFQSRGFYTPVQGGGGYQSRGEAPLRFDLEVKQITPLSRTAFINYSVPYSTHVKIAVYDVSGRMVYKVVDGEVKPGKHSFDWKGCDHASRRVASGIYFIKMTGARPEVEDYKETTKIVVLD